jgi:putative acyl-CoA dehydrogenase
MERAFARVATAIAKYWLCKRVPAHVGEALECLGGNGYVEESIMPRLYREAPLYSIWEGSGNVICLDILRALAKETGAVEALVEEFRRAPKGHRGFDHFIPELETDLARAGNGSLPEAQARRLAERLALALQASLLLRHGSPAVTDAFLGSRLDGDHGQIFGTLPALDVSKIFTR